MATLTHQNVTVQLTQITCGECSGTYAISERYRQQRYQEGKSWTCPYCRVSWGYAQGENAKLKADLEIQRARADSLLQARNAAQKEARTANIVKKRTQTLLRKTKDRVKNGVCPCCQRSFAALARHMKTKHPEYTP